VTQDRASNNTRQTLRETVSALRENYYVLLGLHPSASAIEIRRAYRELSKRYHPDTTELPQAQAKSEFQRLNEAYATLGNPERRAAYDVKIRYARMSVMQPPPDLDRPVSQSRYSAPPGYIDPVDRPLSAGEVFALFLMGLSLLGSLFLAIAIALLRGDPL